MKISERASRISPSLTLEITAKANEMKKKGIPVISFGAGEPDFPTPQYIIDAAKKALDDGKTKYTAVAGIAELKQEICDKFLRDNGLSYSPDQIVVSCGAKSSLYHALSCLLDRDDEVIIPTPYWLTYPEIVGMCDAKCVFAKTTCESNYKLTPELLKSLITPKTKCLILNSPCNPSGVVYSRDELSALGKVIEETGIYVISDEIYEKLVFVGEHVSIASISDKLKAQTVVVNGMSKSYSMTGWRIGYLACEKDLAKAISAFQSHSTSNATTVSQYASLAALNGGSDFIASMQKTFDIRRKYAMSRIEKIDLLGMISPCGAFYIFIDISKVLGKKYKGTTISDAIDFAKLLLEKAVAVIPGNAFGAANFVRISYAVSIEDIEEGFNRIESFLSELE